jgi:uncharacterized protein HemX
MKRIVGSSAAVILALSLGVATYAKGKPQNSGTKTTASTPKTSTTKHKGKKKKHKPTHHKSPETMKKTTPPKP